MTTTDEYQPGEFAEYTGPQEPPQDPRIFNRRQADGNFRPLSGFFDGTSTPANQSPDFDPIDWDATEYPDSRDDPDKYGWEDDEDDEDDDEDATA